jgi:hypothetical protein
MFNRPFDWRSFAVGVVIAGILIMLAKCASAECFNSAKEVWAAHGGSHATWASRHGERCWYARGIKHKAETAVDIVPLPRPSPHFALPRHATPCRAAPCPAQPSPAAPRLAEPFTPQHLVTIEHDQFKSYSIESSSTSLAFLFLQDRMISAGWRLWLEASVREAQLVRDQLLPLR